MSSKNKHQINRLDTITQYFDTFTTMIPNALKANLKNKQSSYYNGIYELGLKSDHMHGRVVPAILSEEIIGIVKTAAVDKELMVQMPYTMNALFAAHLDSKDDMFKMNSLSGTAYLLRDIAKAHPETSYDPLVTRDMMAELRNGVTESYAFGFGEALNIYSVAGKIDPETLAANYISMPHSRLKLQIMADLATSVPDVAEDLFDSAWEYYEDQDNKGDQSTVQVIEMDDLSYLYALGQNADEKISEEIFNETFSRMSVKQPKNTYYRMRAAREMEKIMAIHPEGQTMEDSATKIIEVTRRSLNDAATYEPADENQALNDYTGILKVIVDRMPHRAAEIETLANEISAVVETENAKPDHDWNWSLSMTTVAEIKEKAALAQNKPAPEKTANESFFQNGKTILDGLFSAALANLNHKYKPGQP